MMRVDRAGRGEPARSSPGRIHASATRRPRAPRRHHARCRGKRAPTSPLSANCAPDRQLWLIPSGPVVEKVPAKGERPGLKG